jgi:hypothetical protein
MACPPYARQMRATGDNVQSTAVTGQSKVCRFTVPVPSRMIACQLTLCAPYVGLSICSEEGVGPSLLKGLSSDKACVRQVLKETVTDPQQRLARLQVGCQLLYVNHLFPS